MDLLLLESKNKVGIDGKYVSRETNEVEKKELVTEDRKSFLINQIVMLHIR